MQTPLAKIKEIFTSIQGEGPYVGQKHLFIRFSKCNLSCSYCDTDFKNDLIQYSPSELYEKIKDIDCDTISLTGGEPLLEADFLVNFLNKINDKKIYLETNGTLVNELKKVIDLVDIISMDIKIESATNQKNRFIDNENFIKTALDNKKEIFIKLVFDKNISNDEINSILEILKKYNVKLILQPKMPLDSDIDLIEIYDKFYKSYKNVFLIPQTHKFLNII